MKTPNRPVYSTDGGRLCAGCGRPVGDCHCAQTIAGGVPAGDGIVRLQRQTKGRNGKAVVLITGLALPPADLKALGKELKAKCGVGGSIEGHDILIQGDQRQLLQSLLENKGYTVKLAGG